MTDRTSVKVLHTLAWYLPDSTGGTEVYVSDLIDELGRLDINNEIAAAGTDSKEHFYEHNGVAVYRYPASSVTDQNIIRGHHPPTDFDYFSDWLRQQDAAIYHQHSWTATCGQYHLQSAKAAGFKTVLTIHVPAFLCMRGTMMLYGDEPCDGYIDTNRCSSCWLQNRGLPGLLAGIVASLPLALSQRAETSDRQSRLITAIAARALAENKYHQFENMMAAADKIVVVCEWLYAAFRVNDVPEEKLVLSRQGVSRNMQAPGKKIGRKNEKFRIGYLGRWHPTKGVHILLSALKLLPDDLEFELVLYGLAPGEEEQHYRNNLLSHYGHDQRIQVMEPISREQIAEVFADLDVLAVPSQWMETGPLVVLEAQAAGVSVLGSNLGGIRELVQEGINGWLVQPHDPAAWADAICGLVKGEKAVTAVHQQHQVRTMADVAQDMHKLYLSLI